MDAYNTVSQFALNLPTQFFEFLGYFMVVYTTENRTFHYRAVSVVNILPKVKRCSGVHGMLFLFLGVVKTSSSYRRLQ